MYDTLFESDEPALQKLLAINETMTESDAILIIFQGKFNSQPGQ
jgi:hypothetical protein